MNIMEVVMCCLPSRSRIIGRKLHRCEIFCFIAIRNNDNAAWMLACCTLDICASFCQIVFHRAAHILDPHLLAIAGYIAICRLIGDTAYGASTEGMSLTKDFFNELMCTPLVFI